MRILVDVDGVMADFVTPVVNLVNNELGTDYTAEDIDEWEVLDALDVPPRQRELVRKAICSPGFCRGFKVYPGVEKGLAKLRKFGRVIALTAPFESPFWEYERRKWLQEELGFSKHDIMSGSGKEICDADFLIDDKPSNVINWQEEDFISRRGILLKQTWNVDAIGQTWHGMVANDWKHLVALIRHYV